MDKTDIVCVTSIFWIFLEAGQFHSHHHLELVERCTHFKQIPRPFKAENNSHKRKAIRIVILNKL